MDCCLLLFQKKLDTVSVDPERQCLKPSWEEALKVTKIIFIQLKMGFYSRNNQHIVSICEPI